MSVVSGCVSHSFHQYSKEIQQGIKLSHQEREDVVKMVAFQYDELVEAELDLYKSYAQIILTQTSSNDRK